MLTSNHTKKTALLVVAVFATVMIMGPSISGINNVLAKQKYNDGMIVEMIIVKTGVKITLNIIMITTMVMVTKHLKE